MITRGQLSSAVSTQFEVAFLNQYNVSVAVTNERFQPLVMEFDVGDNQGNIVDLTWLGAAPQLRKWVDEKRAVGLNKNEWSATIERFEASIEVDIDAMKDARWNIYVPRIREMANNAARHRYNQASGLIKNGATTACYDGQNFYSASHSEGLSGSQSNLLTGNGTDTLAHFTTDYYAAKSKLMGYLDDKAVVLNPIDFRPLLWIPNDPTTIQTVRTMQQSALINAVAGTAGVGTNILQTEFDYVVDPQLTDGNDWYMFRTDTMMKQFIRLNREPFHYEDNFAQVGNPDVFDRRIGKASVVGRDTMTYGLWQGALKVANA